MYYVNFCISVFRSINGRLPQKLLKPIRIWYVGMVQRGSRKAVKAVQRGSREAVKAAQRGILCFIYIINIFYIYQIYFIIQLNIWKISVWIVCYINLWILVFMSIKGLQVTPEIANTYQNLAMPSLFGISLAYSAQRL